LLSFTHTWLPTVQEVLQADWHEAWHSPQPRSLMVDGRVTALMVFMCFPKGYHLFSLVIINDQDCRRNRAERQTLPWTI